MPLQENRGDGTLYILDEILYVDGENGTDLIDGSKADIRFRPQKVLQDVVSIEVSDIQIDRKSASMFAVYNKLDMEIEVDPFNGDPVSYYTFTVTLPPADPNAEPMEILEIMDQAIRRQSRLEFVDGNWIGSSSGLSEPTRNTHTWNTRFSLTTAEPGPDDPENPDAPITIGFNSGARITQWSILFESGANASTSPAEILGFEVEDLILMRVVIGSPPFDTYYFTGKSPNQMNVQPYNFIDITVDEVPELNPVFRFYPKNFFATRIQVIPLKPRLLTEPIKKLERLTIRYRLENGLVPISPPPIIISFRVFHLLEGIDVPDYLKNRPIIK